jgi:DNA polymerase-3 subunit delta'
MDDKTAPIYQPEFLPWHGPVLENILSLKQQQRLPHAILINAKSEQDGIGFIWHLMMLLLCEKHHDVSPCGQCQPCRLMLSNSYPDIVYVTLLYDNKKNKLNKNIKIEQIRELIHELHLTRRYDNLKIAAIYPADKMSIEGANSLLKTLEEPASHTLILLITHNRGKLPITIRSRCQIWSLDHPVRQTSMEWLQQQGMNQAAAEQYIEFSGGDPQLALKLQLGEYATLVDQFKHQFALYLKNEIDVSKLCFSLVPVEVSLVRRLIRMVVIAYCYQFVGLNTKGMVSGVAHKPAAQKVLLLASRLDRQLRVEESNLNLQIQLEDVLISLKQIIKFE